MYVLSRRHDGNRDNIKQLRQTSEPATEPSLFFELMRRSREEYNSSRFSRLLGQDDPV